MKRPAGGRRAAGIVIAVAAVATLLSGCGDRPTSLHLGAVFPLKGAQASLGLQELGGVRAAVAAVNARGGVDGVHVSLDVRDLETPGQAATVVGRLSKDPVVIGAYSSQLSIPAAEATAHLDRVYWEAGAVADQLTGAGSPWIFRVGATGAQLGSNSIAFAQHVLSPRLDLALPRTRVSVVWEQDAYGTSVADAAIQEARSAGMAVVSETPYDAYAPDWPGVLAALRAARPDIVVLASYIPDGVAFRQQMLAARLPVDALIGSTMAECVPAFGDPLGVDAIGIFGSDRPGEGFDAAKLSPVGRDAYATLSVALGHRTPTEEQLSGFTAAWALLHDVLPRATSFSPSAIAAAARTVDIPTNDLPNGAGLRFATNPANMGQNILSAAIVWQWQGAGRDVVVWPPSYATGSPSFIPLPASPASAAPAPAATAPAPAW